MSTRDHAIPGDISGIVTTRNEGAARAWVWRGTLAKYLSLPVLFLVGVAALNLWSLMRTPAPYVDEAWYGNRAYALVQTGYGFGALDSGIPDRLDGYWTVLAWIQPLIESIPIRLLGLSLFALRLESLIFGMALLAVIYAIVKKLYNSRAAFITIAVGAFSPAFILSSHMARPDIQIALCGFGAVALYLYDRSSGLTPKSVVSGLLIGLGLDIHPNIAVFGLVLLALFIFDYRWKMFRTGRLWGFVVGAGMGLAFYIAIHILPYPNTYAQLSRLESGLSQTPTILLPPDIWPRVITGHIFLTGLYLWPIIIGAAVVLLRRRTQSDKRLLLIFTTLIGSFVALRPNWPAHYMIIVAPAAWLLIGALIDYLVSQAWKKALWVHMRSVLVLSLLLVSSMSAVAQMFDDPIPDWQATLTRVRETVPPNSVILGQQGWWFARPDAPYFSWEQLVYHRRYAPGSTLEDAFRSLNPQYLILDRVTDSLVIEKMTNFTADYANSYILKSDLDAFIKEHCRVVSTLSNATFGDVRIYEIVW
jgi:4-amino-4-deoxy-L-arabinose transferase-like glycosyltransferase